MRFLKSNMVLALLGALLLSLGWLGITGIPMLAGLVPLLVISARKGASRRDFWTMWGWCAVAFGLWSVVTTWWIWHAAPAGAIASPLINILLVGGAFSLYHFTSKRSPRAVAYMVLIGAWIAAEYLYTVGEVSFPWLTLGTGFACDVWLVQWYDTTGTFGGSLWVLLCNILIFEALGNRRMIAAAALAVLLPATVSVVKYFNFEPSQQTAKVTVVQPNIEAYEMKNEMSSIDQVQIMGQLMIGQAQHYGASDFYVTPESAVAETIYEGSFDYSPEIKYFRELSRNQLQGAQIILGASTRRTYDPGTQSESARYWENYGIWYDNYNSVIAIDSTDRWQMRHKSLMVIGAEKTPYYKYIKDATLFTIDLGGISGHLGSDPEPIVFDSPKGKYGTAVCYEGIYGGYMTGFERLNARILFIISNDGWWGDTRGYRQLFDFARLRAVELRRSIARSANTGKSGMISPRGDVISSLGWDVRGALTEDLPLEDRITFYGRHGDYVAYFALGLLCGSMLVFAGYRLYHRRR